MPLEKPYKKRVDFNEEVEEAYIDKSDTDSETSSENSYSEEEEEEKEEKKNILDSDTLKYILLGSAALAGLVFIKKQADPIRNIAQQHNAQPNNQTNQKKSQEITYS